MSLARNDLVGLAGPALLARESDERLVALVHDGDENAFAAIVDRYRASLERVCRRTLSPARAEDALQQAFASAYVALSRGVQPAALRAWLTTIAHNAAINELRDRQPESLEVGRELGDDEVPHDIVTRRESLRSVMRAVVDLPSRQRQVIVRQEFGGDSQEQIAGELGLTIGAVRQLAHRARCSIRAAAAALTPAPLWHRLSWLSGPCEGTELVAGSALAVAAKTAVAILVVGVAGGAAELTAARAPALLPPAATTATATATAKSAPHRRAAARPAGAARVPASFGATARATTGRASTAGRPHGDRPQAPTATRHRTAGVAPSSVAPAAQPAAATPPARVPAVEPTPDPHGGDHGIAGSEPGPGHGDHKRHGGSGHGRGGTSSGAAAVSGPGSPDTAAIPAPAADIDHVAEVEDEPQPVPEMDEVKVESDSSRGRNGSTSSEPSSGRAARSG
ncbi:MAG TPA: sigma-70 family RNA polymerase sigma factor [Solirubrobacteraceae bacterium]|nr:sigma-70 family RNA polymerase sigma factor [Solirubrobacteraceae bacterium]